MVAVTGICRVPWTVAGAGVKLTVMVQVAAGLRVEQVVVAVKLEIVTVGVAIWSGTEPVLVKVMVWRVAVGSGMFWKVRVVGLRERPGSGAPKPVSCEEMVPAEVARVREPARWPVAVGLKTI